MMNETEIHTLIGVYSNGEYKISGISPSDIQDYIHYNISHRWGRALFVDGKCKHKGYLSEDQTNFIESLIAEDKIRFTASKIQYEVLSKSVIFFP